MVVTPVGGDDKMDERGLFWRYFAAGVDGWLAGATMIAGFVLLLPKTFGSVLLVGLAAVSVVRPLWKTARAKSRARVAEPRATSPLLSAIDESPVRLSNCSGRELVGLLWAANKAELEAGYSLQQVHSKLVTEKLTNISFATFRTYVAWERRAAADACLPEPEALPA